MRDIPKALLVVMILAVAGAIAWSSCAQAGGWFNEPPYIELGVLRSDGSTYCNYSTELGHAQFGQNFYQDGRHVLNWRLTHLSCFQEENDKNSTNAAGIVYRYYLGDR